MINFVWTPHAQEARCHGNRACFHSATELIFKDKNALHFRGPNERYGTHKKCPGVQGHLQ